eukprot:219300-Amphidinium_carterae.2
MLAKLLTAWRLKVTEAKLKSEGKSANSLQKTRHEGRGVRVCTCAITDQRLLNARESQASTSIGDQPRCAEIHDLTDIVATSNLCCLKIEENPSVVSSKVGRRFSHASKRPTQRTRPLTSTPRSALTGVELSEDSGRTAQGAAQASKSKHRKCKQATPRLQKGARHTRPLEVSCQSYTYAACSESFNDPKASHGRP